MKKCPKCKTLWTDETKFCGKCGTKLEHTEIVTEEKKVLVKEKTETKQIVLPERIITTRQKSSSKVKRIIAGVLIFAVLITGGGVTIHKVSNSINNPYVYLFNGKFYFVRNAEKNEPIEVPAGETEEYIKSGISFSPDEKYLYVLGNYDYENGTGDLYQCQYKKLKKNSSKNEKYCKLIATDIYPSYTPMNEGKVVYKSEDSTLYFYNGKEPKKLQKNVSQFFYTENEEKIAVECGSYSEGYTLYIVSLSNPEEKTEVISDYGRICLINDLNNIYYSEGIDMASRYISLAGIDREKRNLGVMCDGFYSLKDGIVYYQSENEEKYSIDDMITDSRGETETLQNVREELEYISEDGLKPIKMSRDGETYDVDDKAYSDVTHYYGNTLLYASLSDFKPIDLAEIQEDENFIENVEEKIELEFLDAGLHLVSGDNEVIVTGDAARDLLTMIDNDEDGMKIYINATDVLAYSDGQLVAARNEKGKVSEFELLEDAEDVIAANETEIYYTSNKQEDDMWVYYDIYSYSNGKSKCLAQKGSRILFDIYKDGKILTYSNYDDGFDLSLIDSKGNAECIVNGVKEYIRCDKDLILYTSSNGLWMYRNGKTKQLAAGAKMIWSLHSMEKKQDLSTPVG